ncbi:cytochrome c oxidase assembly protein COX19 [Lynx canadensis]|uniref:Cytochrome c oxidase assembly protein COX19 n=1 Tax=Lynx canadensis TaxID=61383 RepID=A0A667I832_LYNCA|nr:cytochrome c oxidase assembly protein COX19 [Lynx canadensis]XP_046945326.1 cytochrome c oxidase assembly protein COX19 isoform X1 [Lynx rufus]
MSTAMNFGSKSFQPRPPDKGSFPLDHFGECKSFKEKFMKCLRDNRFENALCRSESKDYLECRMERQVPAGNERLLEPPSTPMETFFFPQEVIAAGLLHPPGSKPLSLRT